MPFFVVVVLAASPNLAAPGFRCSGVEAALCDAYLEHFVATLTDRGIRVTTKGDMAQVLGVERQRQLIGCSTENSCLAELAGALGVASLLSGTVAKTESGYVSTLKVIDASDGRTSWAATTRVDSERQLFSFFEDKALTLARTLVPEAPPSAVVKWVPAMAGGALAIVGAGLLLGALDLAATLKAFAVPSTDALALFAMKQTGGTYEAYVSSTASTGRTLQTLGWTFVGLGAAAIASSFIWWLATPSKPVVAIMPTAAGFTAGVSMVLP